jgi:hypothetical protein
LCATGVVSGLKIKLTRSPKVTQSMRSACEVLGLEKLHVICHGAGEPRAMAEKNHRSAGSLLGIRGVLAMNRW